jgi:hypothetical protein
MAPYEKYLVLNEAMFSFAITSSVLESLDTPCVVHQL